MAAMLAEMSDLTALQPVDVLFETELAARFELAQRVADEAATIIMSARGRVAVEKKSAIDLVTAADRAAEEQILGQLRSCFAGDSVLSEESDGDTGCERMRSQVGSLRWCWAVDPLDGTTNYTHGLINFAVSIGLLHYGRPVLGVVSAPARDELFVGGLGLAASCNGEPLSVSGCRTIDGALIGTGFPYDRRDKIDELFVPLRRALMVSQGVRRAGAAAIDLCELAAGRLDGFFEQGLHPWDVVAAVAIIEAAGGKVTSYDGGPHDLFAGRTVASNGLIHSDVLELVA